MDPNAVLLTVKDRGPRIVVPLLALAAGLLLFPLVAHLGARGLLALALCAALYVGVLLHVHFGLALLVICFGLSPEFEVGGISNLRLEDLFIPVVVLAWATRVSRNRERLDPTDLKVPLVLLIGLSAVSSLLNSLWSGLPLLSSFLIFGKTMEYYFIYLVVMNVVKTKKQVMAYAFLLLAVSLAGGMLGITRYFAGIAGPKVTGPAGETANIFGGYLAFHMMIAVGMAICIPQLWTRLVLGGYLLANLVPMLFTYSRTTFAAFFGGLVALAFLRRGRALVGVAVFLILLPMFFPAQVADRMETILKIFGPDPPPSWEARVSAWRTFSGLILESPLIGRGVGSAPLGYIDNEYVKQANELGLVGLLIFFWLLIRIFRTSLWTIRRAGDPWILGFCTGFAAGFAAVLIHNLGATSLTSIRIAEPFFFTTGLLYAVRNHLVTADEDEDEEVQPAC